MQFELNEDKTELRIDFSNLKAITKTKRHVQMLIEELRDLAGQMQDHPNEL